MRRVVALALAGTALLAACGGDAVAPQVWAGSVCQALAPWRGQIADLNSRADQEISAVRTPAQTRDSLLKLLSGARSASEQARAKVAAAGTPDVADGSRIAGRFVAALSAVRDAYARAGDTVSALPTTDAKGFYDGVAAALARLNTDYQQAGVDAANLASAQLRREFDEVPACRPG